MIFHPLPPGGKNAIEGAASAELLLSFLCTSLLLAIGGSLLSLSLPATIMAAQLWGFVLLLTLSAAFAIRTFRSVPVGILSLAAFLAIALVAHSRWFLVPLAAAGAGFFRSINYRGIWSSLRQGRLWARSGIAAGLILTVHHYGDFLVLEKLRQALLHPDTLIHASLAAMIKTYGVTSVGIHGLTEIHYHVLSHRLMASLSSLSGIHLLELYGYLPILLLCPLLITAITWCTTQLSEEQSVECIGRHWIAVCAVLTSLKLLPLETWGGWDEYFVSESYILALSLLSLALPAVLLAKPSRIELLSSVFLLLLAGLAKSSVGVFALTLLWLRLVQPVHRERIWAAVLAGAATAAFQYLVEATASAASQRIHFSPLSYIQHYSLWGESIGGLFSTPSPDLGVLGKSAAAILSFLFMNYILSWCVLARALCQAPSPRGLLPGIEVRAVVLWTALSIGTLLLVVAGGGWYFINPPMFIALPFVVLAVDSLRNNPVFSSKRLAIATTVALGVIVVTSYRDRSGIFAKSRLSLDARRIEHLANIEALLALREQALIHPVIFRRGSNFPRDNDYWAFKEIQLVYPAVTERAWVGLLTTNTPGLADRPIYAHCLGFPFAGLLPAKIPPDMDVVTVRQESVPVAR